MKKIIVILISIFVFLGRTSAIQAKDKVKPLCLSFGDITVECRDYDQNSVIVEYSYNDQESVCTIFDSQTGVLLETVRISVLPSSKSMNRSTIQLASCMT